MTRGENLRHQARLLQNAIQMIGQISDYDLEDNARSEIERAVDMAHRIINNAEPVMDALARANSDDIRIALQD